MPNTEGNLVLTQPTLNVGGLNEQGLEGKGLDEHFICLEPNIFVHIGNIVIDLSAQVWH